MRVLALIVAVQCTGFVHAALDFAGALAGVVHTDEDCSDDAPSHDCPPGCPSCHCTNGFLSAIPPGVGDSEVGVLSPAGEDLTPRFTELGAPPQTHRATVYRPPRSPGFASLS